MSKPLALDLFCKAGGAAAGLHRAGFEVVGVDRDPQPRYPFRFIQQDVLDLPLWFLRMFDFIWASPPCQAHTAMRMMHNARKHVDLIPATREMLKLSGAVYVIENVEGAPLVEPIMLCGTMFGLGAGGAELRRHRLFETSFPLLTPPCNHTKDAPVIGVYGGHVRNRRRREGSAARGVADFHRKVGELAMDIDWMTLEELSEAIPPAYSEFIGRAAMEALT